MSDLSKIPVSIIIRDNEFVSAKTFTKIVSLTEQAIFEIELVELYLLREKFKEVPSYIFDAVELNLIRKQGESLLIQKANSGSIILGGVAIGLCYWLLNQTVGETIKEAWLESDLHNRMKVFLLKQLDGKKKYIGASIKKKFKENNLEIGIEVTDTVDAYISPVESEDILKEFTKRTPHQKPKTR